MMKQEEKSTRQGFGDSLLEIGEKNKNVWVLTADLSGSTCTNKFEKKFPERFVQVGVAEQNLVTTASGIASTGKVVFATSFAAFSPGRNWEQIRTTICYNNQPVIVVGTHTGLGVGEDGATHQALEDIALTRVLPNMQVIVPCDYEQAKKATLALSKQKKPSYLRLTRQKSPNITNEKTNFEIGKAQIIRDGVDLVIFGCGPIINEAINAQEKLKQKGYNVAIINIHTIKPLDEKTIIKYAKKCGVFLTIEDHQTTGGLSGAISECLTKTHPIKGEFLGVKDTFGESGTAEELYKKHKLTSSYIEKVVVKLIKNKTKTTTTTPTQKTKSIIKTKKTIKKKR